MRQRRGQSLVEYSLTAGILVLMTVGGLQLIDGLWGNLFSYIGDFMRGNGAAVSFTSVDGNGATTGFDGQLNFALSSQEELTQINQRLNDIFDSLQTNNNVPFDSIADEYFELATQNLGYLEQLETLGNELLEENPDAGRAILELATTGKLLAGSQFSVVHEAAYDYSSANNPNNEDLSYNIHNYPELLEQLRTSREFQRQIVAETGQNLNEYQYQDGKVITVGNEADLSNSTREGAELSQGYASDFSNKYADLNARLGSTYNLTAEQTAIIQAASTQIIARSAIYSVANANNTYHQSKTIETTKDMQ